MYDNIDRDLLLPLRAIYNLQNDNTMIYQTHIEASLQKWSKEEKQHRQL